MVQILLSQAPEDFVAGDKDLPGVPIDASIEALRILEDLLGPRMRVVGDVVIIPDWVRHRLALRLEAIRTKGYGGRA